MNNEQPEEERDYTKIARPIPESNMAYQNLVLQSTKMPDNLPEELKTPLNPEDLVTQEED